jgi:hypothetical protein
MASFSFYTTCIWPAIHYLTTCMYVRNTGIHMYIKYTFIMHFIHWYNIAYNSDPHLNMGSLSGTHIWKVISTKLNTFRAEESTLSVGTTYIVYCSQEEITICFLICEFDLPTLQKQRKDRAITNFPLQSKLGDQS